MGPPLKNPPVYLVLTQVEFNPILALGNHLEAIQESFRTSGYPDFARHQFISLQLPGPESDSPQAIRQDFYQFGNREQTHAFLLNSHGLVLQSSRYGHFEQFLTILLEGLARVHQIVSLDFIGKVGLRYLDRVMPEEGETLDDYLNASARGLVPVPGAHLQHSYTETLNQIEQIQLTSRVIIQPEGSLMLPADIQLLNLKLEERFTHHHGPSATLDNDAFFSEREPYDISTVKARLNALHDVINSAFHSIVTDNALQRWSQ